MYLFDNMGQVRVTYSLLEYISRTGSELAARYGGNIRQVPVSFLRGMDFPLVAP